MPKTKPVTTPQTISLGNIPTVITVKPPKKAGNPEVVMEGIADLCAIDRVIEDLEDAKKAVDTRVRKAADAIFLDDGCATKKRPGNFHGCEIEIVDGASLSHSVSIELRQSGAALSDEAIAIAEEYKIPTEEKVTTHETYIINPVYAQNIDVMQKVVDALNAAIVAGTIPADVLQFQPGSKKTVCTDATLPAVFALPRDTAEIALKLFGVLAVGKHKYASKPGREADLTPALLRTAALINRPEFRAEMQQANAARKAEKSKRRA